MGQIVLTVDKGRLADMRIEGQITVGDILRLLDEARAQVLNIQIGTPAPQPPAEQPAK